LTGQQRRKQIFRQISLLLTIVAVVFIWYGWKHPHHVLFTETTIDGNVPNANLYVAPQAVSPLAFGLILLLSCWACVCSFVYIRAALRLTRKATTPVPALAEIELELRRARRTLNLPQALPISTPSDRPECGISLWEMRIGFSADSGDGNSGPADRQSDEWTCL
jgi:hypothetical protein